MSKFNVTLAGHTIELFDLGEEMNRAFTQLYNSFTGNHSFDVSSFNLKCQSFFDTYNDAGWHDKYFHNFSPMWRVFMSQGQYRQAGDIWAIALEPVNQWEQQNHTFHIHKGAGYYYSGVTNILRRDFDQGLLFMHQALEEDRRIHQNVQSSPALAFVKLDDSFGPQIFQPKLNEISGYLDQLLSNYRADRSKSLTIDEFRSRFLALSDLQEAVFVFVYAIFRLHALLLETPSQVRQSPFTGQLSANLLFDLCLVIENVIKHARQPQILSRIARNRATFIDCAEELATLSGLNNLNNNELRAANGKFNDDFENQQLAILASTFTLNNNTLPTELECDLLMAYGFRNHGGHNVHSYNFVYQRLPEIFQRIINVLFLTCEELL